MTSKGQADTSGFVSATVRQSSSVVAPTTGLGCRVAHDDQLSLIHISISSGFRLRLPTRESPRIGSAILPSVGLYDWRRVVHS
jgi:hypothetical protein